MIRIVLGWIGVYFQLRGIHHFERVWAQQFIQVFDRDPTAQVTRILSDSLRQLQESERRTRILIRRWRVS